MDRESLVRRNNQLAEAFHQPPVRHRLRRAIIESVARFPFSPLTKGWNRVLFIRPDHLGDMLLATPAMRALKAARPYTEIHVLAGAWSAGVLANVPEVDLVLTTDFPGFNRAGNGGNYLAPYFKVISTARQLRQIGYGHAIIMRPDHWWGAMVAHVAGISERIGYAKQDVAPFLTQRLDMQHEHVVRQNLRLVESWTGYIPDNNVPYRYRVYESERDDISRHLAEFGIAPDERIFCIHPGAGTWVKLWDDERWATVADTLIDQLNAKVVFTGGDGERGMVVRIMNRMTHTACMTVGEFNIQELSALYERAQVVLGPDSGPLHLASAVGTPTVSLFGPADPVEFGPWGRNDKNIYLASSIGCRPCRVLDWGDDDPENHPCVRDITVGEVLEAARRAANADKH